MKPSEKLKIDDYVYLKSCPSTNAYAISLPTNIHPASNTAIYTFNQTTGKGQIGRTWYNGSQKNLAISFGLHLTDFKVNQQWKFNMAFSLALINWLRRHLSQEVHIKWPNDIYVDSKKLAGILIQNILRGDFISQTVIGLGLNVNEISFPSDLPNPISMHQLTEKKFDLVDLVMELSQMMDGEFNLLLKKDDALLHELYEEELYLKDVLAKFKIGGGIQDGHIKGVTSEGKLLMEFSGEERVFNFREVEYVF